MTAHCNVVQKLCTVYSYNNYPIGSMVRTKENKMTPKKPVLGRVWPLATGKEVTHADQIE